MTPQPCTTYTGLIGTTVSGVFLYLIAIINIVILVGIVRVFTRMHQGDFDEAALEEHLNNRGFLNRFLGRFTRSISKSWQMYPLGVLFGLGFDTATEIALLVIAGTGAVAGLPWYAVRKVYYNIVITGLSVAVALIIGTIQLVGLFADQFGWSGGIWDWIGGIDLNTMGFFIVGLFIFTLAAAMLVWKYGRIEDKWNSRGRERAGNRQNW